MKRCYIIAGPNGAGKTTFARRFLPAEAECINFINTDLIAAGLSPFAPEKVAVAAGRLLLQRIAVCVAAGESFSFETTLSGKGHVAHIREWQDQDYEVIIHYLWLPSVTLAIERVKQRVARGGHDVPEQDIRRRFVRSWENFQNVYRELADGWVVFDMSAYEPRVVDKSR